MGFDVLGGGGAGGAGGSGGGAVINIGGNTSGTTAQFTSGTLVLAGGNNVTLSQSSNTITIVGPSSITHSFFTPPFPGTPTAGLSIGNGVLLMSPFRLDQNLSASRAQMGISVSNSSSSNSSYAGVISFQVGIYTKNGSTMSLLNSGSTFYQWSDTSGQSSGSLTGNRVVSVPINMNLTPGDYWYAVISNTSTTNANWFTASNHMHTGISTRQSFLVNTNTASINIMPGMGNYTATTVSCPAAVAFSEINGTGNIPNSPVQIFFMNQSG